MSTNRKALEIIRKNIREHGSHIYQVLASSTPRHLYTIGLSETHGFELVLPGCMFFHDDIARDLFAGIIDHVRGNGRGHVEIDDCTFSMTGVHSSWVDLLMPGAVDYYSQSVPALQIIPEEQYRTNEIPDMSLEFDAKTALAWQWLKREWKYPVDSESVAVTDLDALAGDPITEVTRWEKTQWEMFSGPGPDMDPSIIRVVPLGTLLGLDPTLEPVTELDLGAGLWRDPPDGDWNKWG